MNGSAIGTLQQIGANDDGGLLSTLQHLGEGMWAAADVLNESGISTQILMLIGQIDLGANGGDLQLIVHIGLAQTSIDQRSLITRIGAHQEHSIGCLQTCDGIRRRIKKSYLWLRSLNCDQAV